MITTIPKIERTPFNPTSKKHREEYKFFIENNKWKRGFCPFQVEWPALSVDHSINLKIVKHFLKVQ